MTDRIDEIKARLDELKSRWPYHSVQPYMVQELEELEDELTRLLHENSAVKQDVPDTKWAGQK